MRLQKKKQEFEEKGFIFDLYHYLWEDEELSQKQQISIPEVNIPDTIYYKYGEPRLWFFTDKKGHVKKKMKNKLTIEKIEEEFLDKTPQCDIVAFFVWTGQNNQNYRFEYFNPEAFVKFLNTKSYEKEGYLQRFIQSKGTHNQYITYKNNQNTFNIISAIIKTIWSPKVCFHEKYQNAQPINDTTLDIYQRVINVESTKNQCEITQLKGRCLPVKINELSEEIAQHLERKSLMKKKIRQMDLIYKLDSNDKLYLLFCQNIVSERTYEEQQEKNKEFSYSIPNYINTEKIQLPRPLNLNKSNQCLNCEKLLDDESVYQIDLGTIIQAWNFDHIAEDQYLAEYEIDKNEKLLKKQKESKQLNPLEKRKDATFNFYSITKNYQVPNVLRRVFPNLEYDDLLNNKDNAVFQVQKITVCEECYLKVMDSAHYGQNLKNLAKYIIKSSVHKTDDLVPLKNDRIFFHKFKIEALKQEKEQQRNRSIGKNTTTDKNSLSIDPYLTYDNVQVNRSHSTSKILSSNFSSKNQNDSQNSGARQISSLYLKFPYIEMNKQFKPLKKSKNLSNSNLKDEDLNGTVQNQNTTIEKDNTVNHSSIQDQKSFQQKEEYYVTTTPKNKSPRAKIFIQIPEQKKQLVKDKSQGKLPTPNFNKVENYRISYEQYQKLSKMYPKEMHHLNVLTNNYQKYKNESSTSHQKSSSMSQLPQSTQSKRSKSKLPKLGDNGEQSQEKK